MQNWKYIIFENYDSKFKGQNLTALSSSPSRHSTFTSLPIKGLTTCVYTERLTKKRLTSTQITMY